ncbi:MAG: hypothetical protein QOF76_4337 [Solirubrobacteraceae bacterium]|nr:hypothetical protein [Solirubrobacteraceae bacterium]
MSQFDIDTALEPAGDGVWNGNVPANWWVGAGPNGGFMAALAARAVALVTDMPLASLTTHFMEAPVEGPIAVHAAVTRAGRSATFAAVRMYQGDRLVVQAGGVCAAWREDTPAFTDVDPPAMPPPEECMYIDPTRTNVAPLVGNYEIRMATDSTSPVARGWIRAADGDRVPDAALLVAMTDAFIPPPMLRLGFGIRVPTLELTVHVRAQMPPGDDPWVIAVFSSRLATGGTVEEDGLLWSADGRLLAMSRQLSLIRRLEPRT